MGFLAENMKMKARKF